MQVQVTNNVFIVTLLTSASFTIVHQNATITKDWAYQKMQEQNGAAKKDYANANMDPQQIVLSTIWAGVVFWFAYYLVTGLAEGKWGKAEGTDLLHGNLWTLPF